MLHDEVCIQFFPRSCIIVADRKLKRAWYCIGMRAALATVWGGVLRALAGVSRVNTYSEDYSVLLEAELICVLRPLYRVLPTS
jgi:hypothetical protein